MVGPLSKIGTHPDILSPWAKELIAYTNYGVSSPGRNQTRPAISSTLTSMNLWLTDTTAGVGSY
jgi:hypothetical protein